MVIDDEETHLYTAKELLGSDALEVITHQGAFGATNRLLEILPDLILLDINMPGLSGQNLVELIKPYCLGNKTSIFFYSSNDEDSLRELAATHGVQGYICKGDVASLRNKVNSYFAARN